MQQIIQLFKRFFRRILRQIQRLLGLQRQSPRQPRRVFDWVIPGKLAVSACPQPGDAAELLKADVKVVLSLCSELEATLPEDICQNFECLRLVLPDRFYTTELTAAQLAEAVAIVRENIQKDLSLLVHCRAGVERSPTVCIAYLCKYHNMQLWEALNWLKQVHPSSQPNDSGLRAIHEFLRQV